MPSRSDTDVCENCGGQKCMGCVFREHPHDCADNCPACCLPSADEVRGILKWTPPEIECQWQSAAECEPALRIAAERDQLKEEVAALARELLTVRDEEDRLVAERDRYKATLDWIAHPYYDDNGKLSLATLEEAVHAARDALNGGEASVPCPECGFPTERGPHGCGPDANAGEHG